MKNKGRRVLRIRKRLHLSQAELAMRLGVTQPSISNYENGRIVPPDTIVKKINRLYRKSISPEPATTRFAQWLRNERARRNMTQEQLAEKSGISKIAISFIESGRTTAPRDSTMEALRNAFVQTRSIEPPEIEEGHPVSDLNINPLPQSSELSSKPLVNYPSAATSESVLTVLQLYNAGTYAIADFQRDSDEWDEVKKSLFIESVLNNLTIPSLFLAATGQGKYEIIDGQQRLTTLKEFHANQLRLSPNDEADYLGDRSVHYAAKTFSELKTGAPQYASAFETYLLPLIKLPEDIDDATRREIFRRINEAGTPLSAQDIRLAYYGDCQTVTYIRLGGIYDETREGARRMMTNASTKYGSSWPWGGMSQSVRDEWKDWWLDKQSAIGQAASEMFLWFLIATYHAQTDTLLNNSGYLSTALGIHFDGRTEEAADIFCAELKYEASHSPIVLCNATQQLSLFGKYSDWWFKIHSKMPGIGVDRARRMAITIAALEKNGKQPNPSQWDQLESLLRRPRQTADSLGMPLPEARGKWIGPKGQKAQIEAYFSIIHAIIP